jgi:hypothetical protein
MWGFPLTCFSASFIVLFNYIGDPPPPHTQPHTHTHLSLPCMLVHLLASGACAVFIAEVQEGSGYNKMAE